VQRFLLRVPCDGSSSSAVGRFDGRLSRHRVSAWCSHCGTAMPHRCQAESLPFVGDLEQGMWPASQPSSFPLGLRTYFPLLPSAPPPECPGRAQQATVAVFRVCRPVAQLKGGGFCVGSVEWRTFGGACRECVSVVDVVCVPAFPPLLPHFIMLPSLPRSPPP